VIKVIEIAKRAYTQFEMRTKVEIGLWL